MSSTIPMSPPLQRYELEYSSGPSSAVATQFPLDRLASAFDRVRDAWDWRAPIEAVILAEDRLLVEQAITWFTATPPTFIAAPRQPGHLIVRAQGYGIGPIEETAPARWLRGTHAPTGFTSSPEQRLTEVSYKGFRIVARPYQLRPSRRWIVDLEIHRNGRHRSFTGERRAPSESDARARCLSLGREIIDNKVPGWSVQPLRRFPRRPMHRTLFAIVLIGGLSAFAFARGDSTVVLETLSGWINTLAAIFGAAMVAHTAGGGQ